MPITARHAVVIGGGIMGGDIATVFAAHGWTVHVASPTNSNGSGRGSRFTIDIPTPSAFEEGHHAS